MRRNCLDTLTAQSRDWSLSDARFVSFFINMAGEPSFQVNIKAERRLEDIKRANEAGRNGIGHYRDYSCHAGDMEPAELVQLAKLKSGVARWMQGELDALPPSDYVPPKVSDLEASPGLIGAGALGGAMAGNTQAQAQA